MKRALLFAVALASLLAFADRQATWTKSGAQIVGGAWAPVVITGSDGGPQQTLQMTYQLTAPSADGGTAFAGSFQLYELPADQACVTQILNNALDAGLNTFGF